MNKYTLRFENAKLEQEYQKTEFDAFRSKTNSYFLLIFFIICCLNFSSQFIYIPNNPQHLWPLTNILLIVLIFVLQRKYHYLGKQLIFFECLVAISSILQITYSHNMSSDSLNCVLPIIDMISNLHLLQIFDLSCIQILLTMGFKIYVQCVNQPDFNLFTVLTQILSSTIQIITIYFYKHWSRQQFTLYMKDLIWQQQLSNIIQKPFFKFSLDPISNNFVTLLSNKINLFPGFKSIFCDSCNLRAFLRLCQNQNITLEQKLLIDYQADKQQLTQHNYELTYQYNQKSFKIRICNMNIERFKCILILEQCTQKQKQVVSISNIKKSMLNSLTSNSKLLNHKFFKLGILTILHFNNKQIGILNSYDLMKKIVNYFNFLNIELFPLKSSNTYLLSTYKQQLFIFMICIFNILTNLTKMKNSKIFINLSNDKGTINIKIQGINEIIFLEQFKMNMFLMQTQSQLLLTSVDKNLTLKLSNKQMK
ncbi:unnamed protein product [Paramecium pentaurelia]|uniref:Transmembrane protein n=1 Tax=Paramecium pentaurelia TaxID=43138 RepID=A0A8S1Y0G5_9CILI|nr:unnamed protein product [Paramecium pentaurelia]